MFENTTRSSPASLTASMLGVHTFWKILSDSVEVDGVERRFREHDLSGRCHLPAISQGMNLYSNGELIDILILYRDSDCNSCTIRDYTRNVTPRNVFHITRPL
ncbi:hypothetical protein TNCV_3418421 [Trichonephila clavipes]|nr:hypothetical protein TNCV_3418421 [Trichonephila clavipes]